MAAMSSPPAETARKGLQLALQRLQSPGTGQALAAALGTSESTVSRIKAERLEEVITALAHLGLKVVPSEYRCVDASRFQFLTETLERVMREQPQLVWDVE